MGWTIQDWGSLGELVGAIGIVVTLFYLAIQVRHSREATEANTQSMELQSYQAWQAANLQINVAISNPAQSQMIAAGNLDSRGLSEETFAAFGMIHMSIFQMAQMADYLYRSGALDSELWDAEMNRAAGILAFPGVRQMWDAGFKTQLTPGFVELMESRQSSITRVFWDAERGFYPLNKDSHNAEDAPGNR